MENELIQYSIAVSLAGEVLRWTFLSLSDNISFKQSVPLHSRDGSVLPIPTYRTIRLSLSLEIIYQFITSLLFHGIR